nr:PREDICTED: protein lifeguard 2-like [Lepisosteus oculatus]
MGGPISGSRKDPRRAESQPSGMEESQIRRGDYIRKVFSVLTVQLLAILSVLCLLLLCEPLKEFVKTNLWISLNSYLIFILVSAVLLFCLSCRRAVPRGTPGMCLAEDSQAVLSTEPTDTSLEEHSFAALVLSLDISMIFIYLLLLSD